MVVRTHRCAHQEAVTLLDDALAVAGLDVRMADKDVCALQVDDAGHPLEHFGCSYCRGKPSSWERSPSPIRMAPMPGTFFRMSGRASMPLVSSIIRMTKISPLRIVGPDVGAFVVVLLRDTPVAHRLRRPVAAHAGRFVTRRAL